MNIGLISDHLSAEYVNLNRTAYKEQGIYEDPLTNESVAFLRAYKGDWASSKIPWKFADGSFHPVIFKHRIIYLIKQIKHTPKTVQHTLLF